MPLVNDNRRRIRVQSQPLCPVHGIPMTATSTQQPVRYFGCKVPGCKKTAKQSTIHESALRESLFGKPGAYP